MKQFRLICLLLLISPFLHAQSLISISSGEIEKGNTKTLRINASYTQFLTNPSATRIFLTDPSGIFKIEARSIKVIDNKTIDAVFLLPYTVPSDYYTLQVYNLAYGNYYLDKAIDVQSPKISPQIKTLTGVSVFQNNKLVLKVLGSRTHFVTSEVTNQITAASGTKELVFTVDSIKNDSVLWASVVVPSYYPTGSYNLTYNSSFDGEMQYSTAFEVVQNPDVPTITMVMPPQIYTGDTAKLKIAFQSKNPFNSASTTVRIVNAATDDMIYDSDVSIANDTIYASVFVPFGTTAGTYHVEVLEIDQNFDIISNNALQLITNPNSPTISSVSPITGTQGLTSILDIKSLNTNLLTTAGVSTVKLVNASNPNDEIYAANVNGLTDTELEATFNFKYYNTATKYNLVIQNSSEGVITLNNAFEVKVNSNIPQITSWTPTSCGADDASVIVSIVGTNSHFKDAASSLVFYLENDNMQIKHYLITPVASSRTNTEVDVEFRFTSDVTPGIYKLWYRNNLDDKVVKVNAFEIKPSANVALISSVTPNVAMKGDSVVVAVNGSNTMFSNKQCYEILFAHAETNEKIYATTVERVSDVLIKGTFPISFLNLEGIYHVTVNGLSDYSISADSVFTITKNTIIKSVTQLEMYPGETKSLEIVTENGTFVSGSVSLNVKNNGNTIAATNVKVLSANKLQADVTMPVNAVSGLYDVEVIQTGKRNLLAKEAFTVKECPVLSKPDAIAGDVKICKSTSNKTSYSVSPNANATVYEWNLEPASAGSLTGLGASVDVAWNDAFVGTAKLSVRYINTCNNGEWSDVLSINVAAKPIPLFTYKKVNETVTLTNTSTNATSYFWNLGDANVSTLKDLSHNYANGEWNVKLVASNEFCSDSLSQTISIATALTEVEQSSIKLYPNPSNGEFYVEQTNDAKLNFAEIVDIKGNVIYSQPLNWQNKTVKIEWKGAKSGYYILRVYSADRVAFVSRLLIQ
jgi:hypothetical protein